MRRQKSPLLPNSGYPVAILGADQKERGLWGREWLTAHLHLWRMPEMVAPRALVFRPLVKGNEALGTRLPLCRKRRHSGKMTAHAPLFSRVSSVCEWTLEGENEASFPRNFKPSMDGNKFYYL